MRVSVQARSPGVAVLGPQGSGKTLLLRLLARLVLPSGGSLVMAGEKRALAGQIRRQIGVLFEEDLLYDRQSVRSNLVFYCHIYGVPTGRIDAVLTQIGLRDQSAKAVAKLSASEQRRLAFARLLRQAAAEGATIVLTDEDLLRANRCCTRVVELEAGRIVSDYQLTREESSVAASSEQLTPFKVPACREDRILLYDPGDILYATSRESKTYLRTINEEAITNFTLQELEQRLCGRGFFKAHRAYLVNLQRVRAVIQYTRNSYMLQLDDRQETLIPLSKHAEKALQELLGY